MIRRPRITAHVAARSFIAISFLAWVLLPPEADKVVTTFANFIWLFVES